jgi:UDP-N-acetyl-D-glucosamine dehydrogenase
MLHHVVNVVFNVLNAKGKSVNGSRILLLGLAYKANVDDDRESPTYKPIEKLESLGVAVEFHDPYIPVTPKTREHAQYSSRKSVGKISDQYDLLLISTGHDEYRSHDFSAYKVPVVDTRNCVASKPTKYCKA